jgi:hypothetical protein
VGRSRASKSRLVESLGCYLLVLALLPSLASATCAEAWPADMEMRPDFTCVPFTDGLLVSLEGATRSELIKTMKAIGRPLPGKEYTLHFVSVADQPNSGDMNFEIDGDRVVRIFGVTDSGEFLWNSGYHGPGAIPCSDLPDSHYARCNEEK